MSVQHKRARNDTDENSQGKKDIKDKAKMNEHKPEEERSGLKNIENKIRKGINEFSKENQKAGKGSQKSDKDRADDMKDKGDENNKLTEMNKLDWEKDYQKGQSQVRESLIKGHKDLGSQIEKAYQGILQNCLKQSEDEPQKMENCWNEASMKMKPIFKIFQQKSAESGESLKKCFESKNNAKECVRDGIDLGQKAIKEASSSLKQYLV